MPNDARTHLLFLATSPTRSLRPLFLSVIPGNEKQLDKLRTMRASLQEDISGIVNEFGPQLFEDFQQARIIPPSSVPPPPGLTRKRSTYGPQGTNTFLTHPMSTSLSWMNTLLSFLILVLILQPGSTSTSSAGHNHKSSNLPEEVRTLMVLMPNLAVMFQAVCFFPTLTVWGTMSNGASYVQDTTDEQDRGDFDEVGFTLNLLSCLIADMRSSGNSHPLPRARSRRHITRSQLTNSKSIAISITITA